MLRIKKVKTKNDLETLNIEKRAKAVILGLPIDKKELDHPYLKAYHRGYDLFNDLLVRIQDSLLDSGILYIWGSPAQLVYLSEHLPDGLRFRHWIAVDGGNLNEDRPNNLHHSHLGLLMLIKGKGSPKLNTKSVKTPHIECSWCHQNIRDWGGKKHLMNPLGSGISDVWRDTYRVTDKHKDPDNPLITLNHLSDSQSALDLTEPIPKFVLDRVVNLSAEQDDLVYQINIDSALLPVLSNANLQQASIVAYQAVDIENSVILGDCIEEMEKLAKKYLNGLFDLVFADPPYNLSKDYDKYDDGIADQEYIDWCNRWIELCVKLTKPDGNILLLNLPKWALEHTKNLNKVAYFRNWIVWDALSTPKGKIMPAHYAMLHYSKSANGFKFNKPKSIPSNNYCLRASCVKDRAKSNNQLRLPVTDIWSEVHRIKHKKDRDDHPCQLPEKLMDRIVNTFSNEGDLVFDPFSGAGTTAIAAIRNNRKYMTMEVDPLYYDITVNNLKQVSENGSITRVVDRKRNQSKYTKKSVEKLTQEAALKLKRKPTLDELVMQYGLDLSELGLLYDGDPARVLKAASLSLQI